MKKYMAVYTGNPQNMAAFKALDADARAKREQQGMAAWMEWGQRHDKSIVENGGPLGKTKRITKDGIADIANNLAAYTIVQAVSQAAASALFENHPLFTIFPGVGVEVMEILPIPAG
jgi:hypothetical protein